MKIKPIWEILVVGQSLPGSQGQVPPPEGSKRVLINPIQSKKLGLFSMITPNPVCFYLDIVEQLIKEQEIVLSKLINTKQDNQYSYDHYLLYKFLEKTIEIPIILFSALEAFANQVIPEDYIYEKKSIGKIFFFFKNPKIKLDKKTIEKDPSVSTADKFSKILSHIFQKQLNRDPLWNKFIELRNKRNELIHLKTGGTEYIVAYDHMYQSLIDSDYNDMFESTKKIIEFYQPDFFKFV